MTRDEFLRRRAIADHIKTHGVTKLPSVQETEPEYSQRNGRANMTWHRNQAQRTVRPSHSHTQTHWK